MAYFRKYEFDSQQQFDLIFQDLPETSNQTIVPLGGLIPNKFCVDILWHNEIPLDLTQYEVWDIVGNGSHTFLGWDFNQQ